MSPTPTFSSPGPGTWTLDDAHFARPLPPLVAEVFEAGFTEGMRLTMKQYGMLLETIACKVVNGFPYMQARPLGAPPGAPPPPRWLLRLLVPTLLRVHPEMRARRAVADTLFERRPWRDVARAWDEELRAATIAAHTSLGEVPVDTLDDEALALHVLAVRDHARRMITQDHSMNLAVFLPTGDFLVHARAWTGLPETALLAALRGCSAVSAGDTHERVRLLAALRADPQARATLASDAPALERLDALTRWPGEVGAAMRAYRVVTGNALVIGIDIDMPTAEEDPAQLLDVLRLLLDAPPAHAPDTVALDAVRARVPAEHREAFETLLEDARLTYRLRDERHLYGAMPTLGIARKALLAAARRLVPKAVLPTEADVYNYGADELAAMLRGGPAPADWEARRAAYALPITAAPRTFGPPEPPPPDVDWLPAPMARAMLALDAYQRSLAEAPAQATAAPAAGAPSPEAGGSAGEAGDSPSAAGGATAGASADSTLAGLAVSPGVHEGVARICITAPDLARVQPGDVLVASTTTPAINVILPLLGAIVTDRGGALSHAAIVSREYGIPGVVGTRTATRAIPDGARVRVDGARGMVEILG